jgi:hypothetical protein
MDAMTQQNAALVEEAAAASEAMRQQAGDLEQAVSVFRLGRAQRAIGQARSRALPAAPQRLVA